VISAYFMLNDLFLGKVVGDKENTQEISQLEVVLQNLAQQTNFKVKPDEVKINIDKIGLGTDKEKIIERTREIFKQQLKEQLKPNGPLTTTPLTPKNESATGQFSESDATDESAEPASKEVVVAEPVYREEVIAEPVPKAEFSTKPVFRDGKKQKGVQVSKVGVSDNIIKFSVATGFLKKHWIIVKEIPLLEIGHIEKFGKELSVTWNGSAYIFFSKEKTDIFSKLVNQVNGILEGAGSESVALPMDVTEPAADANTAEPQTHTSEATAPTPALTPEPKPEPEAPAAEPEKAVTSDSSADGQV